MNGHYAAGVKILNLEEHKKCLRQVNPDLILVDTDLQDLIFTAWEIKMPMRLLTTWFSDSISLKNPSIRTTIIPGIGFSGSKMGILWSWFMMRFKIKGRVLINRLKFEHYRRWLLKTYAKKIAFPVNRLWANTLPPLYSFTKFPILTMTITELEFPHKLGRNINYIDPMVYENRLFEKKYLKECQQLEEILKIKSEGNKKLVYCSVGSLAKGYLPFLKKVINAVANLDNLLLILSSGPKMSIRSFDFIPRNA